MMHLCGQEIKQSEYKTSMDEQSIPDKTQTEVCREWKQGQAIWDRI